MKEINIKLKPDMKEFNYISLLKSILISAFVIFSITSCDDNDDYDLGELYGYASTEGAVAQKIGVELKRNLAGEKKFNFVSRRNSSEEIEISYKYDASLQDYINQKSNKEYKLFPEKLFTLSKEIVKVLPGKNASDSVTLSIQALDVLEDFGLEESEEYLIPVKATVVKGDISIPEKDSYLAFIVKTPSSQTEKSTGIKIFNCVEINRINPLNALSFKLKESDKYLFDAVILFSVNMQYNDKTKKVHLSLNPKNKFLFDNVEKYVRPLQRKGIKVVFGILPHHTAAGLANLTDEACRNFALEIKKFNDFYGLDGVFLDDEYGYKGTGDPSVILPSIDVQASSRLAYEIKKVMPDKWVTIYAYSTLISMTSVEGKDPGSFVDYILPDYGVTGDFSDYFKGLPKMQMGQFSINFSNLWGSFVEPLKALRDEGYGVNMTYDIDPTEPSFKEGINGWWGAQQSQLEVLEDLTETLFDDELVFSEEIYKAEWAHLEGDPEEWTGK